MGFSSSGAELEPSADSSTRFSDHGFSGPPTGWKEEANHRLAAHRARRSRRAGLQTTLPGMEDTAGLASRAHAGAKGVADRVAERYAKAPTYSEILAAEARNAARAAQAAASAACDARDAAEAILVGLDAGLEGERQENPDRREAEGREVNRAKARDPRVDALAQPRRDRDLQGRDSSASPRPLLAVLEAFGEGDDAEEAFEDEPAAPIHPLPAKLLEFPRELVAARKARPRLAEGPLREEYDRGASQSQLRIFEVESETISTEPAVEQALAGWSSLRLDSPPKPPAAQPSRGLPTSQGLSASRHEAVPGIELPLQTASLEDRLMAGLVDAALVAGGFLIFVLVFAACTAHPPAGKPAAIGAGVALFAFSLMYQILFFSFGQDTPGMRYAKVALCTFDDENPTRRAMRRRIGAAAAGGKSAGDRPFVGVLRRRPAGLARSDQPDLSTELSLDARGMRTAGASIRPSSSEEPAIHDTGLDSLELSSVKSGCRGLITRFVSTPPVTTLGTINTALRASSIHRSPNLRLATWPSAAQPESENGASRSLEAASGMAISTWRCDLGMRNKFAWTNTSSMAPAKLSAA